jgi:hypothetical protein
MGTRRLPGLLIVLLVLVGCSAPVAPTPTPRPTPGDPGTSARPMGQEVAVSVPGERATSLRISVTSLLDPMPAEAVGIPPSSGRYVGVYWLVMNDSPQDFTIDREAFPLETAAGVLVQPRTEPGQAERPGTAVRPGESLSGLLLYAVPSGDRPQVALFHPPGSPPVVIADELHTASAPPPALAPTRTAATPTATLVDRGPLPPVDVEEVPPPVDGDDAPLPAPSDEADESLPPAPPTEEEVTPAPPGDADPASSF